MKSFTVKIVFVASLCFLMACSSVRELALVGTARAVGADGTVIVEETEAANFMVRVNINHLPPPDRLGEGLSVFIVWFSVAGQAPVKAGNLVYDPDARKGELVATTPHRNFTVVVTAEKPDAITPSEIEVAKRQVSN